MNPHNDNQFSLNDSDYRPHNGRRSQPGQQSQLFADYSNVNPYHARVLRYFECDHLPEPLRNTSKMFQAMAWTLAYKKDTDPSEMTISLRKLLEAKDAAVRSCLASQHQEENQPQPEHDGTESQDTEDEETENTEYTDVEFREVAR